MSSPPLFATTVDTTEADTADASEVATVADNTATTDTKDADEDDEGDDDRFPRSYVVKLRSENARYRERARTADHYAKRLHTELVSATSKLADPTDLEFNEKHLNEPDALAAALDDLLARKPHLPSRRPTGDIGQGAAPPPAQSIWQHCYGEERDNASNHLFMLRQYQLTGFCREWRFLGEDC